MKYPAKKMVLPTALKSVENGKIDPKMMKKISIGGQMWEWAAVAFNVMEGEAKKAGHQLTNIGDYRPYTAQLAMFRDRYSDKETGRNPQVTRKFEGKVWYLKKGKAPSGVPGTSNHGYGLAIDLGCKVNGKKGSLSGATLEWMCENAPKYGFYLQGSDPKSPEFEAWHWQYCEGDKAPKPVTDAVAAFFAALEANKKK